MHDHQGQFGKCFRTSVLVSIVLVVTTSTSFSEEPKLPCIFTAKSYEEANAAEIKSARRPVSVSAAADDKNRIVEAVKKISIDVKDAQAYIEVVRADSKASSDQIASALDCQGKLARFLVGQQTASSSSSTRAMTKFNATIAQETQIATVHISRALTPVALVGDKDVQQKAKDKNTEQRKLLDPYVNSHLYNDLGFDISTSV